MDRNLKRYWRTPNDWIDFEVRSDTVHITDFKASGADLLRKLIDAILINLMLPNGYETIVYECWEDNPHIKDFIDIGFGCTSGGEFCCLEYDLPIRNYNKDSIVGG